MQTFQLEPGETILMEKRKHWFEYLWPFGGALFNAVLPFLALALFGYEFSLRGLVSEQTIFGALALYGVWLLFIWTNSAIVATNIYLDVLVVTNRRIIDIEQKGLFARTVSSVRFDRIQDITVEVHGLLPTLLRFGTVRIQTAGEEKEFVMRNLHEPYAVKDFIMKEHHRALEMQTMAPQQKGGLA